MSTSDEQISLRFEIVTFYVLHTAVNESLMQQTFSHHIRVLEVKFTLLTETF